MNRISCYGRSGLGPVTSSAFTLSRALRILSAVRKSGARIRVRPDQIHVECLGRWEGHQTDVWIIRYSISIRLWFLYPWRVIRRIHEYRTDCFFWDWTWTEWPSAFLYGFGGSRAIGLKD